MTDLATTAADVKAARLAKRWGVEKAAREADVSSITWKRVEDGLPVRDTSLVAVLEALGLRDHALDGRPDVAGMLAEDPTLDDEARAHLVNQYKLLQELTRARGKPDPTGPGPHIRRSYPSSVGEEAAGH